MQNCLRVCVFERFSVCMRACAFASVISLKEKPAVYLGICGSFVAVCALYIFFAGVYDTLPYSLTAFLFPQLLEIKLLMI